MKDMLDSNTKPLLVKSKKKSKQDMRLLQSELEEAILKLTKNYSLLSSLMDDFCSAFHMLQDIADSIQGTDDALFRQTALLNSIVTQLAPLSNDLPVILSTLSGITQTLENSNEFFRPLEESILALNERINDANQLLSGIDSSLLSTEQSLNSLSSSITTSLSSVTETLSTVNTRLNAIDETLNTVDGSLSTINATLSTINGALSTINGVLNSIDDSISTINGTLNIIDDSISTIEESLSAMNANLTTISSSVSRVEAELATLSSQMTTATGQLNRIQTIAEALNINFLGTQKTTGILRLDPSVQSIYITGFNNTSEALSIDIAVYSFDIPPQATIYVNQNLVLQPGVPFSLLLNTSNGTLILLPSLYSIQFNRVVPGIYLWVSALTDTSFTSTASFIAANTVPFANLVAVYENNPDIP